MNVRVKWTLPVPGARQRPIASVRIEKRAEGVETWTVINELAASSTELLDQDVPPGTWRYRAVVIDEAGLESPGLVHAQADVPFDPPSDVTELTATLE